jgi:hypothetical protein
MALPSSRVGLARRDLSPSPGQDRSLFYAQPNESNRAAIYKTLAGSGILRLPVKKYIEDVEILPQVRILMVA